MPEAGTTKHENKATAKFWLFSVIPAEAGIQFFLYDHGEPAFPLDCPARQITMYPEIGAGQ